MHRLTRHGLATAASLALAAGVLAGVAPTAQAGPCSVTSVNPDTGQVSCAVRGPSQSGGSTVTGRSSSSGQSFTRSTGTGAESKSSAKKSGPPFLFDKSQPAFVLGQSRTAGCGGSATTTTVSRQNNVTGRNTQTIPTAGCQAAQPAQGQPQEAAAPVPQITPQQAAQAAIAKLKFTSAGPGAGPTRTDNDLPFDAPVGYPVWLWADGGTTADRRVSDSVQGMGVQITVRFDQLTWDPGDGSGTFTCGTGTPWVKGGQEPAAKSPTCGYVYQEMGKYTLTAITSWTVTWTAGGQTGTVPVEMSQDRPFDVGELQTILTGRA